MIESQLVSRNSGTYVLYRTATGVHEFPLWMVLEVQDDLDSLPVALDDPGYAVLYELLRVGGDIDTHLTR